MITIITPLVLGSIVTGGITLLSNPMLFRFLTSLRYQTISGICIAASGTAVAYL